MNRIDALEAFCHRWLLKSTPESVQRDLGHRISVPQAFSNVIVMKAYLLGCIDEDHSHRNILRKEEVEGKNGG